MAASVMIGLETIPSFHQAYLPTFHFFEYTIQFIFTIEIILRIASYGRRQLDFFKSGWNTFDFLVTALFYLPFGGPFASVLRLVRIFRVFRLVTALPKLQLLVGALIKSIPSIGYVGLLLLILFYIFAIVGIFQFGAHDQENFGSLGKAMMTLFQVVTLEGWVDIYKNQNNIFASTIYFVSFILFGTMIVLNLFIGVILNGFDEVKKEVLEAEEADDSKLEADLHLIMHQIDDIKANISKLNSKLNHK